MSEKRREPDAEHPDVEDDMGKPPAPESSDAGVEPTSQVNTSQANVQLLRAVADLANLRKRMHKEVDEARRRAIEAITSELLPVLDNFHLALGARSQAEADAATTQADAVVDGLRMVKSMLEGVLERHGLSEIPSAGAVFDPNIHEAVGVDTQSDSEPGRVVQVMARGYRLGDRVLRPSRVLVSGEAPASPGDPTL